MQTLPLWLTIPALAVVTALLCHVAARMLRCRLGLDAMALAVVLAVALVAPRLSGDPLLVPTGPLNQIPGAPVQAPGRFDVLNDADFQFLPWEAEVRHAFAAKHLPFWSDRLDGGSSPWVNPQAQMASIPAWLARVFPLQHFLLAALVAKLVLAACGAWVLARRIGLRRQARAVAAISYAAGGAILAWSLFPHSSVAALAPWLGAAAIEVARRRGVRSITVAALATAAVATGGHPETALFSGLAAAALGLRFAPRRSLRKSVLRSLLAATLGLGLAAPLLIPFALALPGSTRHADIEEHGLGRSGAGQTGPRFGDVRLLEMPLHPQPFGHPYESRGQHGYGWPVLTCGYAGLAVLAGAGLLLFARRYRRYRSILGIAVLGYLLAANFLGIDRITDRIPGVDSVLAVRVLPIAALLLVLAGAAGWESLARGQRLRGGLAVLPVLALAGFLIAPTGVLAVTWLLLGAAATLLVLGRRRAGWSALAAALLVDLAIFGHALLPAGPVAAFFPRSDFMTGWIAEANQEGRWRTAALARQSYPDLLAVYGFEEIRPHNPLAPETYLRLLDACCGFHPSMRHYFGTVTRLDSAFVDFLGVRWAIVRPPAAGPPGWERRPESDAHGAELWRNPRALPRWFVPSAVELVPRDEIPNRIATSTDPRRIFLPRPVDDRSAAQSVPPLDPSAKVELVDRIPGDVDLRVTTSRPTLVATSLLSPAGWSVTSAGEPLPKLRVHDAFLGFVAPAGTSAVELVYRPPGWRLGLAVAAVALAVLLGLALAQRRRNLAAWHPRYASRRLA